MHGHILAYHKPAKREALLPTGQISGLVCGLHNGLFYTYGVLAQNNKKNTGLFEANRIRQASKIF